MIHETPKIEWRYRETRDSEFATARVKGFEIQVQDCDGDFSRWQIKRGDQYIVMGEESGPKHWDDARRRAIEVWSYVWKAVDMNDFVANEIPRLRAVGEL